MKTTNSWRGKSTQRNRKTDFPPSNEKEGKRMVAKDEEHRQRGSTPNCLVLTWKYLRILCPMSSQKLNILIYISQRASGINRNIPHDRHQQQTQFNLD